MREAGDVVTHHSHCHRKGKDGDGVFGVRAEANNNGKMGKRVRTVSSVVKEACPVQTLDTKLH